MNENPVSGQMALRPKDAAKALGISTRHLWTLTAQGHIPCARVGSGKRQLVVYPVEVLRAWLAAQASQRAADNATPPNN
jgi:excisionase family DNA binding protein